MTVQKMSVICTIQLLSKKIDIPYQFKDLEKMNISELYALQNELVKHYNKRSE